jgi:sensor histidine kinase YesM
MQLGLRLPEIFRCIGGLATQCLISCPLLWRGGLIALGVVFVLSTQFLFQVELYSLWPLIDIVRGWLAYFLQLLTVGACIFFTLTITGSLNPPRAARGHLVVLASIAFGALVGEMLLMPSDFQFEASMTKLLLARTVRWWVVLALAYTVYVCERRATEAASQAHASELQRTQLERQLTEALLHRLRAQIEPHFLFNTLANVQRLCQIDPLRGRKMLANFVAYLRAALPEMRQDETTLKQELELARAYLEVLQVRMGERLRFRFYVARELDALAFPPFALSTLTENAIKHGLNPLREGGAIEIAARTADGRLVVDVSDTGAGLRESGGSGAGLANLRARLAALYGDMASLDIEANVPRGIRATIAVPIRSPR